MMDPRDSSTSRALHRHRRGQDFSPWNLLKLDSNVVQKVEIGEEVKFNELFAKAERVIQGTKEKQWTAEIEAQTT